MPDLNSPPPTNIGDNQTGPAPVPVSNADDDSTPGDLSTQNLERTARCRVCFEPIYPESKRCTKCNSYQDWRRFFDFSAVILSLLVALISVLSVMIPQLRALFSSHGSELEIHSSYYTSNGITLVVENHGSKPGHVGIVNAVVYSIDPHVPWTAWNTDVDLATPRTTKRTVLGGSTTESLFVFPQEAINELPTGYPDGLFWNGLYNESIRIAITAELWDYGKSEPKYVDVTPKAHTGLNHKAAGFGGQPFWQGFTTINQMQISASPSR